MADHDHTIDTGKGTFTLEDLGPLMPGMAEIMPLVGQRIWKCCACVGSPGQGRMPIVTFTELMGEA